ncbi:hypothetical protein KJ751_01545 [Patescibacteria group bacterium]|nr:hypothetical protein [Patescibacteria group bacterium]
MKEEKGRFYKLEKDFYVALQSNFPPEEPAGKFLRAYPAPAAISQEKGQIFHQAEVVEEKNGSRVSFSIATNGLEKWKNLVFFSKTYTAAARWGELKSFGFEKTDPRSPEYRGYDYLPLAFPGITGDFSTVYFKIVPKGKGSSLLSSYPFLLAVDTHIEDGHVVVVARRVGQGQVPRHLLI